MVILLGTHPGPFGDSRLEEQLDGLPRPRIVTIAGRDRIILLFVSLFLCLWTVLWARAILERSKNKTGFALFAVFFQVIFASLWLHELRRELRNRSILANGEFALGRVTSQEDVGGKTRKSMIKYEFADVLGRTWNRKGYHSTKAYTEPMSLMVFNEPDDPSQNVALCTTVWRLRSNGGI